MTQILVNFDPTNLSPSKFWTDQWPAHLFMTQPIVTRPKSVQTPHLTLLDFFILYEFYSSYYTWCLVWVGHHRKFGLPFGNYWLTCFYFNNYICLSVLCMSFVIYYPTKKEFPLKWVVPYNVCVDILMKS